MAGADHTPSLAEQVRAAAADRRVLAIRGAGTKRFLTGESDATPLDVTVHRGIVHYEPTELVITARAGTPLAEIEAALAERNQMLGFEPPHFGPGATLGGTLACGLSGPRRPYAGSARDFVLGTRVLNGRGDPLRFGGEVMKNVAGFDLSRLMTGSRGTLGVLLEASLKVLPRPAVEMTLAFDMEAPAAIQKMNVWAGQPLPLSAAAHTGDTLYIRLSGSESGVRAARQRLGGAVLDDGHQFWSELREHRRGFFQDAQPLWRLSVPPAVSPLALSGKWLLDWGGAQRWLKSDQPAAVIAEAARAAGGYAMPFGREGSPSLPLTGALLALQRSIRQAFDPIGVFAPIQA